MKSTRRQSVPVYRECGRECRPDRCEQLFRAVEAGAVAVHGWTHGGYPGRKLPARVLPGLNTVGFWSTEYQYDWMIETHYNEGIELMFVENGRVTLDAAGRQHTLFPDDVSATRPWLAHRLGSPCIGPTRVHWFVLDVGVRRPRQAWRWPHWVILAPDDRREIERLLNQIETPTWRADASLRQCFLRIADLIRDENEPPNVSLMAVLINEALVLLLQQLRRHTDDQPAAVSAAQRDVAQFWEEVLGSHDQLVREWTLPGMARRCGLGVTQFVHLTRRLTNLPPLHYLQQCRLEHAARELLARPEHRVVDIALSCGFNTGQYFAQCFRQRFGCSPQMFRISRQADS